MDWYFTVFELIDFRSFSNLWFWIMLAVFWSTASHFVMGIPYDMVTRINRGGARAEEAERDLEDLARINSNRLIYIGETAGFWLVGFGFFVLSALFSMGFFYNLEICQALFLLLTPMSIVVLLSLRWARMIQGKTGPELRKMLRRHRISIQVIGMVSIFVTSIWGMHINMTAGVL
ncbi:MAG: component of SufBCD complex [Litoreibacter sp.]|nr:component of SufBCD complex [Litoreibacter sp.]